MAEEDSIFDPTLKKKKKKKKTTFDIDAALAEGALPDSSIENIDQMTTDKENQEPPKGDNETKEVELDDGNLDLENFGKKKKKKKKPFNMEELDGALPESGSKSKEEGNMEIDGTQDEGLVEDSFDLDMDFSKTKKKKKTKKKDLDDFIAEDEKKKAEDRENVEDSQTAWFGEDRDYTYDELLTRVFDIMRDKNPDMVAGKKQKFVMRPPQVVRIGTKKHLLPTLQKYARRYIGSPNIYWTSCSLSWVLVVLWMETTSLLSRGDSSRSKSKMF